MPPPARFHPAGMANERANDDEAPSEETPAQGGTDPGRARTRVLFVLYAGIMIALPLRYYLGDDPYDERFAWRMFSDVRVAHCQTNVEAHASADAPAVRIPYARSFHAAWPILAKRNRPAVVESMAGRLCEATEAPHRVRFITRCRRPGRDVEDTTRYTLACESGDFDIERDVPAGGEEGGS